MVWPATTRPLGAPHLVVTGAAAACLLARRLSLVLVLVPGLSEAARFSTRLHAGSHAHVRAVVSALSLAKHMALNDWFLTHTIQGRGLRA